MCVCVCVILEKVFKLLYHFINIDQIFTIISTVTSYLILWSVNKQTWMGCSCAIQTLGGGTQSHHLCYNVVPSLSPAYSLCLLALKVLALCADMSSSCRCAGSATVSEQLYLSTDLLRSGVTVGFTQHLSNLEAGITRRRGEEWLDN